MTPLVVEISDLEFRWSPDGPLTLSLPRWQVAQGERIFLHGPSGCGKSTLLSLIGGVLQPTRGQVRVLSQDLNSLPAGARDRFRGEHIGFVFQQFNLLPWMTALDNVCLAVQWSPQRLARLGGRAGVKDQAQHQLQALGLMPSDWDRPAGQLSVGQQQRVAAARALLGQPPLIIADEPTSSLDAEHQQRFIELLKQACQQGNCTLLFVSHDERLSRHFDRCVFLPELQGQMAAHNHGAFA